MIYFPYNEELCNYTDTWLGELYENKYPFVSKGMWSGIINLKTCKFLNWELEYGDMYLQVKICDSGTYFLLDKDMCAATRENDVRTKEVVGISGNTGMFTGSHLHLMTKLRWQGH